MSVEDYLSRHKTMMPHQLAVATGMNYHDAVFCLETMVEEGRAYPGTLIYHTGCGGDVPVHCAVCWSSVITIPERCDVCGDEIEGPEQTYTGAIYRLQETLL